MKYHFFWFFLLSISINPFQLHAMRRCPPYHLRWQCTTINIVDLLVRSGAASFPSQAQTLIQENKVSINGEIINNPLRQIILRDRLSLQIKVGEKEYSYVH